MAFALSVYELYKSKKINSNIKKYFELDFSIRNKVKYAR